MKNALGERRGHIKGVRHVVRKPTPEVSSGRQLTPREYWKQNVGNVIEENIAKRVEEQVQRNKQEFHRRVEEQVQRQVNQQLEQLQEEMRRHFNQQLEQIASTFKRKEQVKNRQFRLLPSNRGDGSGRRDYRGDSSGSSNGSDSCDGSGDDEDDG
ncbi:hypothetical protein HanRHA438_Chr16g0750401 [Helianthus annuus]|uniref:Uncharacterized protein n=1 Tax=Helianthus annuus TaxID=4232 RepID=A0A9K3DR73_HELAN|nr:hypothetical protein HanXRQr2_Chr16g0738241 [Helianthus annuus]KAJ0437418.1 hypothetical protein HanHA300_Chr16g0601951 [Helianthus annuus]KAJ0441839.1 hypothetical protein HanIR_Chr16g0802401 [Helianthus annuus]KAJ0459737.1 hypothetical protein HanHA89_Chr16g0652481 [Helianthus annuus]KAJ0644166.1 hypothetical protein HanOQP8_Chr16g0608921 [Helianthus annuus]